MQDEKSRAFLDRYKRAKQRRDLSADLINDAYEFCLPLRERINSARSDGKPNTDRQYDSTAPEAVQDLASEMLDDIWPTDSKPFELRAGRDIPEDERGDADRKLAEVTDEIIETINNSNFRDAAHQALQDWTIGTGTLLPERGDATNPVNFRPLSLTEAIYDIGPRDTSDALYRLHDVPLGEILLRWPDASLDADLDRRVREKPQDKIKLIEGAARDWSERGEEVYPYMVVSEDGKHIIRQGEWRGWGRQPFITFSYTRVTGEALGRGPAMLALGDIKTLNLVKEMILENADLAISGLWQAEDDGVVNPENIMIAPGTIIPRAPGSKGLEALRSASDFNVGDIVAKDLRLSIRSIFLGDDLGPPVGTPMSATEVLERTSNRAKRRAGPYTRLLRDLMGPVVTWTARELNDIGRIKLPAIDGRSVVFRPLSPLTRAQAQDEILRHLRFLEIVNTGLSPQTTQLMVDQLKCAEWFGAKLGVNPNLLRNSVERKALVEAISQMATTAQQGGQGSPA